MFTSLRKTLAALGASLAMMLVPIVSPAAVYAADINSNLGCGSNLDISDSCSTDVGGGSEKLQSVITTIINIFSIIVGIVAVIMIIFSGWKYMTSNGEPGNITSARNALTYAIVGLVIVALAQFIVKFVLQKVNTP